MNKKTFPQRVKSVVYSALNWIGFSFSDFNQWNAYYGQENNTGERVTADRAMTLSGVWSCVRLISQTISTLPVGIYEKTDQGRESQDDHPLLSLIRNKPNADMTAVVFWECMIAATLLRGNAFAEIKRMGGRIISLEFLHPDCTSWKRQDNGAYVYVYTDENGKKREILEQNMFHLPGFSTCGKFGMSAIQYGAEVFGSGLAANKAANKTFANGLHPTIAYKYPEILKDNQREEARETIANISGSVNAGKPAILEAGMDAFPIGINPNDAQLLESRNYSIEEVCRWFGVPPSMVGATDKASSWASSSESLNLWFLQYGLRPLLKRIEAAIWDQLLSPADKRRLYAEFNVQGLLRADTAGRTAFYSTASQNGWLSRNEIRKMENMPPVEGGEVYTVQSNLIPIGDLGKSSEADNAQQALMAWIGSEQKRISERQDQKEPINYSFNLQMPDVNVSVPEIHNNFDMSKFGESVTFDIPAPDKSGKKTIKRLDDGSYEVLDAPVESDS